MRDAQLGTRVVDKLVKVYPKDDDLADEIWVFIHVEVQGFYEKSFGKRMYIYNYRLFDRYNQPICSLGVLADEKKAWKPQKFSYDIWGCKVSIEFPIVKLLDYQNREPELEKNSNPFALVVLAYLKSLETKKEPDNRFQWKLRLFKLLYQQGYSKQDILELTRFIDWIMVLPKELEERFDQAMNQFEEELKMRYVTSFERIWTEKGVQKGIQQGIQQGILQGRRLALLEKSRENILEVLSTRFTVPSPSTEASLAKIEGLALLKGLLKKAVTVESLQEFRQILQEAEKIS